MQLDTVIFDMDGLLIDSEPLWQEAGTEIMANYGKQLTTAQYETTIGLRTREWLEYWFRYFKIPEHTIAEAEVKIVDAVIGKIKEKGKALPGVEYIFQYFKSKQYKIGLATSSPLHMANVVIEKLGISKYLDTVTSAEHLPFGKPHPQVFMQCAAELGSDVLTCICFEDSFNGMIAAKAAKMKCVVVPAHNQLKDDRWGAADLKISSLQNFNDLLLLRFR
jgi:HAD superfamily hydrolase (TIGR01509 family)